MSNHEPLETIWVRVSGRRIHARCSRYTCLDQTPVVLVHGLVVSSRYMIPLAERLAHYRPVYAPDLPGFGRSDHPARPLDIPGLADALASWMRVSGIERAALLGNSLGCQVIADLALRYPERAERLVLVGPTMDQRGRNVLEQTRRLLAAAPYDRPSLVGVQLRDVWSAGPRETLQTTRYALEDAIEAKLPRLALPALVVRGARDPIAPQAWVEQVTSLLPRARLCVIPGGHALNYSKPEALLETMLPFLGERDGGQ